MVSITTIVIITNNIITIMISISMIMVIIIIHCEWCRLSSYGSPAGLEVSASRLGYIHIYIYIYKDYTCYDICIIMNMYITHYIY